MLAQFEEAADLFSAGLIQAALGEKELAFEAFQRVDRWSDYWPTLSVHQYFPDVLGPLRPDPRFGDILRKVNRGWGLEPDDSVAIGT